MQGSEQQKQISSTFHRVTNHNSKITLQKAATKSINHTKHTSSHNHTTFNIIIINHTSSCITSTASSKTIHSDSAITPTHHATKPKQDLT